MGINSSSCQAFFCPAKPENLYSNDLFSSVFPISHQPKQYYNTLDPILHPSASLIDSAYYSFKEQMKIASQGFKSVFWLQKEYQIVSNYSSEKLVLKSEFFANTNDEKCLKYFKKLSFLKASSDDYTEKILNNESLLINLKFEKKIIFEGFHIGLMFKSYRSTGVYFVATGFESGGNERITLDTGCLVKVKVLGFHAQSGSNQKTRIFSILQVENCNWYTKSLLTNWYCEQIHNIHLELS